MTIEKLPKKLIALTLERDVNHDVKSDVKHDSL